jgi:hypothetical protein
MALNINFRDTFYVYACIGSTGNESKLDSDIDEMLNFGDISNIKLFQ